MKEKDHLPLYGVGPIYAATVVILTAAAVLLRNQPIFRAGEIIGTAAIGIGHLWMFGMLLLKMPDELAEILTR